MRKIQYTCNSSRKYVIDLPYEHDIEDDFEFAAESAAQDFHNERDGFEGDWPKTVELFTMEGQPIGKFMVDREYEPTFSATKEPK